MANSGSCFVVHKALLLQDGKTGRGREYIKGEIKLPTPLLQDRQSGGIEYRKGEITSDTTVVGRKIGGNI